MSKQDFQFHFKLRVRWSEADAQGIVYNAKYVEYLEIAQSEYYRNLGIELYNPSQRSYFDTATVKITVEFKSPALLDEILEIYSRVNHIGNKSIQQHTEIYRAESELLLCNGDTIYVGYDSDKRISKRVPDDIRHTIEYFEKTGLTLSQDKSD